MYVAQPRGREMKRIEACLFFKIAYYYLGMLDRNLETRLVPSFVWANLRLILYVQELIICATIT